MKKRDKWHEAERDAIDAGVGDVILPAFHDLVANLVLAFGKPISAEERMTIGGAVLVTTLTQILEGWVRECCGDDQVEGRKFEEYAEDFIGYCARYCGVQAPLRVKPLPELDDKAGNHGDYRAACLAIIHTMTRQMEVGCARLKGGAEEQAAITLYGGLGVVLAHRYIQGDAEAGRRWLVAISNALGFTEPQINIVPVRP